jgi:hypothetical protein
MTGLRGTCASVSDGWGAIAIDDISFAASADLSSNANCITQIEQRPRRQTMPSMGHERGHR